MLDELKEILKNKNFSTVEEAQKFMNEYMQKNNQSGIDDFGGLSPEQMSKLLYITVYQKECPIFINKDLNENDLTNSLFYQDTKRLLKLIMEYSPQMTATKKMNRDFVKSFMDITGYDTTEIKRYNKVVNEEDFFWLHILRVIFELAGLIRKMKGHFIISSEGKKYLEGESGELYHLLFYTFFYKFNLVYMDGYRAGLEFKEIQDTINFSIFMAVTQCNDWIKPIDLSEKILYKGLRLNEKYKEQLSRPYWADMLFWTHYHRFIRPMINLGLFEEKIINPQETSSLLKTCIKKTPLLDKFIKIQFNN